MKLEIDLMQPAEVEAAIDFLKLAQAIMSGKPIPPIAGVWYMRAGERIEAGRGEIPPSLDELGNPGWHLFDPEAMAKYCTLIPIMAQRGCPFSVAPNRGCPLTQFSPTGPSRR